jgi:hypothetical protein
MNNTYERRNGVQFIAKDFITESGKKLSEQPAGGSSGANSPLKGNNGKALTNNTANSLFTFPLADGEGVGLSISFTILAKKGAEFAIASGVWPVTFFNNGGVLVFATQGLPLDNQPDNGSGTSLTCSAKHSDKTVVTVNHMDITATITDGVVTVKFHPGNVGTTPDSIHFDYVVLNPAGDKEITFL